MTANLHIGFAQAKGRKVAKLTPKRSFKSRDRSWKMAIQRWQCEVARGKAKSCKRMLRKLGSRSHWSEVKMFFRYLLLVPSQWLVYIFSAV